MIYRYQFPASIPLDEVEASLVLALFAAESVHTELTLRLQASHYLDHEQRAFVLRTSGAAGEDLHRILYGFLSREFGAKAFSMETIAEKSLHDPLPTH